LALKFDFSGGQIENIARRVQMVWVLEGRNPDFDEILKMCGERDCIKQKKREKSGIYIIVFLIPLTE